MTSCRERGQSLSPFALIWDHCEGPYSSTAPWEGLRPQGYLIHISTLINPFLAALFHVTPGTFFLNHLSQIPASESVWGVTKLKTDPVDYYYYSYFRDEVTCSSSHIQVAEPRFEAMPSRKCSYCNIWPRNFSKWMDCLCLMRILINGWAKLSPRS